MTSALPFRSLAARLSLVVPRFMLVLFAVSNAMAGGLHFSLNDTQKVLHTDREFTGKRMVVLIFVASECPISNSYVPAFNELKKEHDSQGVAFYGVLSDPTEDASHATKYVKEFGYSFPVLVDSDQSLARYTGATVTPEAAVLSPKGELLYLGRIDDLYQRIGVRRYSANQHDLNDAIKVAMTGKKPEPDRTKAVGCAIPFELRKNR